MFNIHTFLNTKDFEQIKNKGIENLLIEKQIKQFISGIPSINIVLPATIENSGVKKLSTESLNHYIDIYNNSKNALSITKFVPASGAATRMF